MLRKRRTFLAVTKLTRHHIVSFLIIKQNNTRQFFFLEPFFFSPSAPSMALQYTPQQLAGGGKYSAGVLIGNYYEDGVMDENELKAYAKKKLSGNLATSATSFQVRPQKRFPKHNVSPASFS